MARLIISNQISEVEKFKESNHNVGFLHYNEFKNESLAVLAFKKLKVNNENFFVYGDDFVVTAGSLIYKESIGLYALKKIYNDINSCNDIPVIKDLIIGAYLLCVKRGDHIYIFGDSQNAFDVFYYFNERQWFVTNYIYGLAMCIPDLLSINEFNVIEESFQTGILDNGTVFNEINRLMGDEYIDVEVEMQTFSVKHVPYEIEDLECDTIDKCAKDFAEHLINYTKITSTVYNDDVGLCMTGGLDSRILLASYLHLGIKPKLFYGRGESKLSGTSDDDLNIVNQFANRFNLSVEIMNWGSSIEINKFLLDELIDKYGFYTLLSRSQENWINSFNQIDELHIMCGYYGELYRNISWLENHSAKYFSLDVFLDDYYIKDRKLAYMFSSLEQYKHYRTHVKLKLCKICEKYKLDPLNIPIEKAILLIFEYRKISDSRMINFLNQNQYYVPILCQKNLAKYMVIPHAMKKNGKFMLKVMEYMYPFILEIPVFSHGKYRKINKNTFELSLEQTSSETCMKKLKLFIIQCIGDNYKLYSFLMKVRANFSFNKLYKEGADQYILCEQILDLIKANNILNQDIKTIPANVLTNLNYAINLVVIKRIIGEKS